MTAPVLFIKSHNPGYQKKDGTYVAPFEDKRFKQSPKPLAKWSATGAAPTKGPNHGALQHLMFQSPKIPDTAVPHPRLDEKGKSRLIHYPSTPSSPDTWEDYGSVATFVPNGPVPKELYGVKFEQWTPPHEADWDYVDGQDDNLEEPPFPMIKGKKPASGVIVTEPDGRVWIIAPTNRFSNTINTFPKGQRDEGLSLQANAIKECFEETGLKVRIEGYAGDIERETSVARYYHATRVSGTPADCGWETQAVRLAPVEELHDYLNRGDDREILKWTPHGRTLGIGAS